MPETDGRSLWPILIGGSDPERPDETFSEHLGAVDAVPSRMVRNGPWKLYKYHDTTPPVLYNLEDDPGELNDLGTDPEYETVRNDLLDRLYDGWDPDYVLRETAAQDRDLRLIAAWGSAIQPGHPDTLAIPEGAEEVEIL
jgi:arylsulfatase A-like enzyme